jgi:drug/metabolite transporter (DMT)-like permease
MTLVNFGTAAVLEMSCTPLALLGFALTFREERFSWRRFNAICVGAAGPSILFGPAAWARSSLAAGQFDALFWGRCRRSRRNSVSVETGSRLLPEECLDL